MPKDFNLKNLFMDLEYTVFGTEVHAFLWNLLKPHEGQIVLEPGCGCGKLGLSYALGGAEAMLLDVDPEVVSYARRIRGALNSLVGFPLAVEIRIGNIHRMKYSNDSFDFVFNEGVPQHWVEEKLRQGAIDQMVRVSRDLVAVIGNNGLRLDEQEADKGFEFTYKGMPPHRKCFTPDELEMRLKRAGLKGVVVEPITPGKIESSVLIGGYGRKK